MRFIRLSINILSGVFVMVITFHILILTGVIHYNIAWGGRLNSKEQMLVFETVSILLNGVFLVAVLIRSGRIKSRIDSRWIRLMMWIMTAVFLVNTVGNLFAINPWERYLATPITLALSGLSLAVARDRSFYSIKK